ncbi:MAG: HIT family protein [Rickettsiales bacterium]|jgi:diadenosine tetraphosphate (Ap4A) HIT family hydrolase|nr:HIT family protein [Rickettsiales bacterium]
MVQNISTATAEKFRIGELCLKKYKYWWVLLRVSQATLGSLVLINTTGRTDFGDLTEEEAAELAPITKEIEAVLRRVFSFDKINYLMLRMKDPEVHFHIIPRYSSLRTFNGREFLDKNWPVLGDSLNNSIPMSEEELMGLYSYLAKELGG